MPLAVPAVGDREAEYIRECLASGWVSTAGPWVGRFERAMADYIGARYSVATSNGTGALHLALAALGAGPGDAVLVPDLTFIAPINAIRYCGAEPIFIDVDPERWQMDPLATRRFLAEETRQVEGVCRDVRTGRRVRAILPVHLLGLPAPFDELDALAREYGLAIVQDAAQSLGAEYRGRRLGALGGVTSFSFNGNKIITCGAGGLVTTDIEAVASRAHYLATQAKDDPVYFRHEEVGYNYRLSSLHAALGLAQLERLQEFIEIKRSIFDRYRRALSHRTDVQWVTEAEGDRASYWLSSFSLDGTAARRDRVLRALLDAGIEARPPWRPNHTQRPYQEARRGELKQSLDIAARGLHLPSSVTLSEDDQQYVIHTLERALGA